MKENYSVKRIKSKDAYPYLLNIHYAKRIPSISYAFGLFIGDLIVGVVTYGCPSSAPLRSGIAGPENSGIVIELNRLCLANNLKNEASILVSSSLKMLPKPSVVVSFADTDQGHAGFVYQACNFTYHGLSAKRTDWKVRGLEHLHGQTIADEFRGVKDRVKAMREKYGDDFYLKPRSRKHRYIYIAGSRSDKKRISEQIRYKQENFPKNLTADL